MWTRAIILVDLDAFYASVEQLRAPELRGRPVIVGGAQDSNGEAITRRGVVSAASYEARAFGVHSAMPLATALRLCPTAAVVPVDFPAYRAASAAVFAIAAAFTPLIQPASLDEAYLDVTGSQVRFGTPAAMAVAMRDRILDECGLNASFGVATNRMVAKIASDLEKPRGLVVVEPGSEAAALAPLELRRMPGLGPSTERSLSGLGITTLGELAALPPDVVARRIGERHGAELQRRARGIDDSSVTTPGPPKSISREETFGTDTADHELLHRRIRTLAADVARRLRDQNLRGRTVTLRMRYHDFTSVSRDRTLKLAADADTVIAATAMELLNTHHDGRPLRLVGVGMSQLVEGAPQTDLFDESDTVEDRRSRTIDEAMDAVRARFGAAAVRRGGEDDLRDLDFRGEDLRPASTEPE